MNRDEQKEINNQENSKDNLKQNLVHKGGQAAATYFGGAAGKKLYDAASKTELGQKIEKAIANGKNRAPNNGAPNSTSNQNSNPNGKEKGLEENNKNEKESKKSSSSKGKSNNKFSLGGNDEEANDELAKEESLIAKFKKLPAPIKGLIFTLAGYFLAFLGIVLLITIIMIQTSVISENQYSSLATGSSTSDFYEDDTNYFSSVEDSKIEKAEKAYYKKLQEVYEEFNRKYGVSIDTTLITATLFYGRTIGDYGDEEGIEDIENSTDTSNPAYDEDKFYEDETVEFYKLAKRHIKTLAKYMLVQNITFNACVDSKDQELYETKPYTSKEIADSWTTISTWKFGDQRLWNSRNLFNYQEKDTRSYTKADGTPNTIDWCNYSDVDTQLHQYYLEDREIYLERKAKYETCVNTAKAACRSGCPACESLTDCSDRDDCHEGCNGASYDDVCGEEKTLYEQAERIYRENWTNEGLYDDNGFKSCVNTSKWGFVQEYNDPSMYMNYAFELQLVDKASIPNFLHHYEYMIHRDKPIKCSAEPAISYRYGVETEEEGVYYYKLMAKTPEGIMDFTKDDSFIERYYPDLIDTSTEESKEKTIKNVVDEIYLLHYTVAEREYRVCYTPSNSNTTGVSGNGSTGVVSTTRTEFINSIANDVIVDMENTGILASVTIAQAILESGNGGSKLANTYNNYYGMTAGSCAPERPNTTTSKVVSSGKDGNECSGNAYWDGTVVWMCNGQGKDCQWYRVYDSFANSTHDHSRLLSTSHYSCQGIFDPNQALACIQNGGYATDPQYISKVMSIIDGNNLTQFDIGEWNGEVITDYSGNGLGTVCFTSTVDRDLALGNQISNGEGTINGFIGSVRTQLYGTPEYNTYWGSNNNIFHASGYDRECTWYANGRGMEILVNNGMSLAQARDYMRPMHGNAGKWFGQNKYFSSSVNVNEPKVGAIIVWSNGSKPGHVAIIENIHYDASGKPVSVDITHGGQSINGFRYDTNKTLDWVAAHTTYRFTGYVYLLG